MIATGVVVSKRHVHRNLWERRFHLVDDERRSLLCKCGGQRLVVCRTLRLPHGRAISAIEVVHKQVAAQGDKRRCGSLLLRRFQAAAQQRVGAVDASLGLATLLD